MRFSETDGLEFERTVVTGVPLSAVLVVELTQTNSNDADTQKSVSLVYRDRKGRTRRDRMPSDAIEKETLYKQLPLLTTINDPAFSAAIRMLRCLLCPAHSRLLPNERVI